MTRRSRRFALLAQAKPRSAIQVPVRTVEGVTRDAELYGFLQLPIYRYVSGIQLSASHALVFGITTRF